MTIDSGTKLFKDLEEIISKHFENMQREVIETGDKTMLEIFPSILLQLFVNQLFATNNPLVATAICLSILGQNVAQEAGKTEISKVIH